MDKHRHSIRLKNYDYSQLGLYFVTICTENHSCLFGNIIGEKMVLNNAGKMIEKKWIEIPQHYYGFEIDAFQIMPNHFHGIIICVGAAPRGRPNIARSNIVDRANENTDVSVIGKTIHDSQSWVVMGKGRPQGAAPTQSTTKLKLSDVIGRFKSLTTKYYIDGVKQHNWRRFTGKLWQRGYYEHIIRNNNELHNIREYINNNSKNWNEH